jgi:hypothetical protein
MRLSDALEVAKAKAAGAVLVPLPEEGSTAIERARSRISGLPDRW